MISLEQLGQNVTSMSGRPAPQDATAIWRLAWWNDIVGYTFRGPYFWTGKGYGVNLADDDGYQVTGDDSLRSPHNGHLNILARSGVPGLAIWAMLNLAWAWGIFRHYLAAARPEQRRWRGLFIFLLGYWLAFTLQRGVRRVHGRPDGRHLVLVDFRGGTGGDVDSRPRTSTAGRTCESWLPIISTSSPAARTASSPTKSPC